MRVRHWIWSLAALTLLFVLPAAALAAPLPPPEYGAKGALADSSITLPEALTYALQDEYLAQARYDAVLREFGQRRPFTQIKAAEQRHIQALLSLCRKYRVPIPPDTAAAYVDPPVTLQSAFAAAVQAEIDNIAMYAKLSALPDLPGDVTRVFTNLENSSRNHLSAFRTGR